MICLNSPEAAAPRRIHQLKAPINVTLTRGGPNGPLPPGIHFVPDPGRPISYAKVGEASLEILRGVGGMMPLPLEIARPKPSSRAFDRFRALAGRETDVQGIWVRQIAFEDPR